MSAYHSLIPHHLLAGEALHPLLIGEVLHLAAQSGPVVPPALRDALTSRTICLAAIGIPAADLDIFARAGRSLGASIIRLPDFPKGTTHSEIRQAIIALDPDLVVMAHAQSGAAVQLSKGLGSKVLNAGDGQHQNVPWALAIVHFIAQSHPDFPALRVALVGDISRSAIARSLTNLLHVLGSEVTLCDPSADLPEGTHTWGAAHQVASGDLDVHHFDKVIGVATGSETRTQFDIPACDLADARLATARALLLIQLGPQA